MRAMASNGAPLPGAVRPPREVLADARARWPGPWYLKTAGREALAQPLRSREVAKANCPVGPGNPSLPS